MTYPRVLCLGEILFDCLADKPGVSLEEVESWTAYAGGAPANVACALAKLGTAVGFIGAVGGDELGDSLVQVLQESGVDIAGVQRRRDKFMSCGMKRAIDLLPVLVKWILRILPTPASRRPKYPRRCLKMRSF
jgi:pfkB family carbohydrate kinase